MHFKFSNVRILCRVINWMRTVDDNSYYYYYTAWKFPISHTCVHSCLTIRRKRLLSAHHSHLQGRSGTLCFSPSPPSTPPSTPFLLHVRTHEHAVGCGSIQSDWIDGWVGVRGWGEGLLLAHTGHEASQPDGDLLEWITMNPVTPFLSLIFSSPPSALVHVPGKRREAAMVNLTSTSQSARWNNLFPECTAWKYNKPD